ncbi:MAG: transposase [Legionella sp.]
MALTSGFFTNKTLSHQGAKPSDEYTFIDVGSDQFHAAAVALIDALQSSAQRGNEVVLKKILERFYQHFPKYISNQPYLTLPERMGILLNSSRKSELVECMAYVLRQLAVDELYTHPLKYREIFDGLSAETPKSYLRDPQVELPASALNALAHALGMDITLSFKELGKELRKREVYVGDEGDA